MRLPRRFFLLLLSGWLGRASLVAQTDTLPLAPTATDLLEDVLTSAGSESGDFDFNGQFDLLEAYRQRPLNLNRCTEQDLREMGLLSDAQILAIIRYRNQAGTFLSTLELQSIPDLDVAAIRRLLPYVTVQANLDDFQVGLGEMARDGRNELQLRWSRFLEDAVGFTPSDSSDYYRGDPNQLFFRYRHTYYNRLSFGITAEKDRGEEFFSGNARQGFDFYSAHFFLQNYRKGLKAVALGDFNASFGQGLILFSGFSYGKSALAAAVKRNSRSLRPYASVNESNFLRGAGATIGLGDHWEFTAFYSNLRQDGNLTAATDTAATGDGLEAFSAFIESGFHRTATEIENRRTVRQTTGGASLQYIRPRVHLGLNAIQTWLDKPLTPSPRAYNQFYFRGDQLANVSVDYSFILRNWNFFGETALSDNGAMATVNGLLVGVDRRTDLAILYRHYPRDYQTLYGAPFAETGGTRNEEGLYFGLESRPIRNWSVSAYFDLWRHPWLRFQVDAPSRGHEYRLRLTFEKRRRMRAFVEWRQEFKEENQANYEGFYRGLAQTQLGQLRFFVSNQITKALELRSRADWSYFVDNAGGRSYGFAVVQDLIFQPIAFPLSFNTRFAIYDTDGYQVRFYYYENDLLNTFSIPPYYNRGSRFYFNVRYRPVSALTLEARFAQTFWANQKTIGSGLDLVDQPRRTQVSAQVKYVF